MDVLVAGNAFFSKNKMEKETNKEKKRKRKAKQEKLTISQMYVRISIFWWWRFCYFRIYVWIVGKGKIYCFQIENNVSIAKNFFLYTYKTQTHIDNTVTEQRRLSLLISA